MPTTQSPLEAAMAQATASHAPVARKLTTTKAERDAAHADLDARARAGETVQGRNNKGQFLRAAKVFSVGAAPVARKAAKVTASRRTPTREAARAVWMNEAASLRGMVASARRYRDVPGLQLRDEASAIEKARRAIAHARWLRLSTRLEA